MANRTYLKIDNFMRVRIYYFIYQIDLGITLCKKLEGIIELGTYTKYKHAWIDTQIDVRLRSITEIILKNISDIRSIILAGGFGKGEGSVEITQDGNVVCLRDFDIVVIVDRLPKEKTQRKLNKEIYKSLGLPNPESKSFRFTNFVVGIYFRRKKDLIYPDIWFYDLKAASQLLYGEDVRSLIPWSKKDIPLSSGLRILFEKVCGLLGVFCYPYLKADELPEQRKKLLIFECYKTFIEICTALSILAGRYEPKYAMRAKNLENFYFDKFPDFAQALPDLPKKVMAYTNFKLKPDFAKVHEDPIQLWFFTRNSLGTALRFYLRRYLDIILSDWDDLPEQMKIVARHYYKSFLYPFIYAKLHFSNKVMLDIANFLYQSLTNMEYTYVVTTATGKLYLHPLRRCYTSPSLKFFPAGIMILFSLRRDGTIDKDLLEKAAKELRHCIPVQVSMFDTSGWETLREHFLKAYSLCSGYHFVK